MPRLERQCTLDGRRFLVMESEGVETRSQIRPERRMIRVGRGRPLEQFARGGSVPTLHQLQSPFVQYRRVIRRALRRARQQLLGLAAAARGRGGPRRLDDSQNGGLIGCHDVGCLKTVPPKLGRYEF